MKTRIESTMKKTMKKMFKSACALCFMLSPFGVHAEPIEVLIKLSPVGSYVMKTNSIDGKVTQVGDAIQSTELKIPVKTLRTGVALRDKHTLERLESDKFPYIVLKTGAGKGGKGQGLISVRGIEKPISGTYEIQGQNVAAKFQLSLKDFGIEKIRYLGVGVKDSVEITALVPLQKADARGVATDKTK